MPRLDPAQLLNCLSILLSPDGGIKSKDVVQRLSNMMMQFSKKLVSKCIYIQILKCTETELLGLFMAVGGWRLVHLWLTESIVAKNWPLVRELLELLLLCPVDLERLKTNNCPKLIKELSKDGNHLAIRALASKLVEQWLKTVQGELVVPIKIADIPKILSDAHSEIKDVIFKNEPSESQPEQNALTLKDNTEIKCEIKSEKSPESCDKDQVDTKIVKEESEENEALPVLKITVKDGKQVLTQVEASSKSEEKTSDKHNKSKSKSHEKSSSSSSKSSSSSSRHSKSHSSSSDKHKSKSSSSSKDSRRSKDSSSSSSSSKDKSKDRHSSKSKSSESKRPEKSSSSSSKGKEERRTSLEKDKNKEKKDKDSSSVTSKQSDEKTSSPSIHKLGKIPKLSDSKKDKPSISIEVRKPDEPKPKTVKTFNSKFRKHGLEEEIKPPPSRASVMNKKVPPALPPTIPIPKRPSPVHNEAPPEKKPKTIETVEKPGAIKLIPAKPKPVLLLESDLFMDALNASATNKREPKKRKRRTSNSKDGNAPNDCSPPTTPTPTSPTQESKSVPPRFYQDTLESDELKEKPCEKVDDNDTSSSQEKDNEPETISEPHTLTVNGLKGVLCYHKRKGPKKSIKWKPDTELEEIQYFELDETERVNVTKTFTDMKYLEIFNEREAVIKARNLLNDDVMEEKTSWRSLIMIDTEGQIQVEYGKNSKEKDIQAARQKGTLQPLYFHKSMIPDSPLEPDLETHIYSEPTIIPLDDITGNQDNISDFRNMPWPEPKGNAPPTTNTISLPNIFPTGIQQFPNAFPPTQFTGVPGFQGPPHMIPGDWPNNVPPMMQNPLGGPMPPSGFVPGAMQGPMPGNMPPGMVPDGNMMMGPGPEMFVPNGPMFPVPDGFNMQQNMFPMDFNMAGGVPGPDVFQGPQNFRGPVRGRGGHWRGKSGGNWDNSRGRGGPTRGGGGGGGANGRKTVCIYFQRKGSCRQGDKCTFLHPGVNCPY